MNKNLTEIIILLDRSGSMPGLETHIIGGFNNFIQRQCSLGQTNLTVVLYDSKYEILYNGVDASTVTLTKKDYYTRSSAALSDAIGKAILDVNFRLSQSEKTACPEKVIFIITKHGPENSGTEYTYEKISKIVSRQKELFNWIFILTGTSIDVISESRKLGIDPSLAFSYQTTSQGIKLMYQKLDYIVKELRLNKFSF